MQNHRMRDASTNKLHRFRIQRTHLARVEEERTKVSKCFIPRLTMSCFSGKYRRYQDYGYGKLSRRVSVSECRDAFRTEVL